MKELKISTKLASTVLGKEVTKCSLINKARNSINISYFEDKEDFNTIYREWSIYEFAFKCKEWIFSKGYSQLSGKDGIYEKGQGFVCSVGSTTLLIKDFYADTEIEAIIKACQWILEDLKEKI